MAYLQNLKVKKVSFVTRGANRKQFFLAKSADSIESSDSKNNISGGTTVRPEIKQKAAEILKAERNIDKVVALLKEDAALKATEAEITEIRDFLALIPAPDASALETATAAVKKAEEEKRSLEARLNKIEEDRHREEIAKWVAAECAYLNMPADEATAQILKAEKIDPSTAEMLKKSFKSTSDVLKTSKLMTEVGRDSEPSDPIAGNLVSEVAKKSAELRKSGNQKPAEAVIEAIKAAGPDRYERYRKEFHQRTRMA